MTFSMRKVLRDKQALRERIAGKPIGEKLRMLGELRAREVAIRGGRPTRAEQDRGGRPIPDSRRGSQR